MFPYACEKGGAGAARRPLPPRPDCRAPAKPTVPLRVWIIAGASCFSVCAALVLATVLVTRWGTDSLAASGIYEVPEPMYANPYPQPNTRPHTTAEPHPREAEEMDNDIQYPILEKLSIFKNVIGNRDKKRPGENLASKPQLHPMHDTSLHHPEKKIEKKDQAVFSGFHNPKVAPLFRDIDKPNPKILAGLDLDENKVPEFKPTLPDVFLKPEDDKFTEGYVPGIRKHDYYEDYYNDENLYDDYMQSNTMTNYLIEKVQELHDWITSDPDFKGVNATIKKQKSGNEFSQLLKALNESLIEGNVTIVMSKLKDLYFSENLTNTNQSKRVILSNSTDLLSFGILTLDVMLLHNIQLMAWENQEWSRLAMLRDPNVFAFHALFLDPAQLDAARAELRHDTPKRQNRQEMSEGKSLLENVLELGMSTARAAIHLGRLYKNTKNVLNQLSTRDPHVQGVTRDVDANTLALGHLQASYSAGGAGVAGGAGTETCTELECVWVLYCRNLEVTARLGAPYGTMARINGIALRLLRGELGAARALAALQDAGADLHCDTMFPRCSNTNAAAVVMDSITQPSRKPQTSNRP